MIDIANHGKKMQKIEDIVVDYEKERYDLINTLSKIKEVLLE